ncbi:MAG: elongation factor Ts [Patescibacteria group bacterium]
MASEITMDQVKALRDKTGGISIMQCKKALEEAGGDEEKAIVLLRKKGAEIAAKKGDRTFGAGAVQAYIHSNGTIGAMVELASETDFVANNADFKTLAYDIAMHVSATNPQFVKKEEVTEDAKAKAMEVFAEEVKGKPDNLKEQILAGKLDAYFKDSILLEQPFIKNPDLTIQQLIDNAIQKFGEKIEVARFARFNALEK